MPGLTATIRQPRREVMMEKEAMLLLTRSEVASLLGLAECIDAVEEAQAARRGAEPAARRAGDIDRGRRIPHQGCGSEARRRELFRGQGQRELPVQPGTVRAADHTGGRHTLRRGAGPPA